jgi:hypothetical protein
VGHSSSGSGSGNMPLTSALVAAFKAKKERFVEPWFQYSEAGEGTDLVGTLFKLFRVCS